MELKDTPPASEPNRPCDAWFYVFPAGKRGPITWGTPTETYANLAASNNGWQVHSLWLYEEADPILKEAALWLHAAYDRPPQSPECIQMLARVDNALKA